SNLYYFTGFEEPDSLLVFRPGMKPETVLFVRPKDPDMETWTGFRFGPDGAKSQFGVDAAMVIDSLEDELSKLLLDIDEVYYSMFINAKFDRIVLDTVDKIRRIKSRANKGNMTIHDPKAMIGEMRLRKSPYEIEQMRKA